MIRLGQFSIFKTNKYVKSLAVNGVRCLATNMKEQNCEEVRIPVPWGHIAGKWWGPQNKRPILVLHGWQDNCGSFDKLIPQLPKDVGYLAVDYPGHGQSSQLPPGMFYHFMDGPKIIRQIKEHFQWPKCSLIGHSLGSIMAYTFGSMFPHLVDFVVCIDALNPLVMNKRIDTTVKSIEDFIKYNAVMLNGQEEKRSYSMEEMEQILHGATRKSIDIDNCKYILERKIAPSKKNPGKFYFATDARLKCGSLLGWTPEDCFEGANRVNFPTLLIMANSLTFQSQRPTAEECINIIRKNNANFEFHSLKGTHHVHLNEPKKVAEVICPFIIKHNTEERTIGVGDIKKCSKL